MHVVIVGSGLSGLVCARSLHKSKLDIRCTILEVNERPGGRIFAPFGIDIGGAWTWPQNDKHLGQLCKQLDIELEEQKMGYPAGYGGMRIKGSAYTIVEKLASELNGNIEFGQRVESIEWNSQQITIKSNTNKTWSADYLVLAIPPQQVTKIQFQPELPRGLAKILNHTPTWMAGVGKFAAAYDSCFWNSPSLRSLSTTSRYIAQAWDNSTNGKNAICGFVFEKCDGNDIKKDLILQFGEQAKKTVNFELKFWGEEDHNKASLDFGHPDLVAGVNNRIFFASTESVPFEAGHMEGAVQGGLRTASQIQKLVSERQ